MPPVDAQRAVGARRGGRRLACRRPGGPDRPHRPRALARRRPLAARRDRPRRKRREAGPGRAGAPRLPRPVRHARPERHRPSAADLELPAADQRRRRRGSSATASSTWAAAGRLPRSRPRRLRRRAGRLRAGHPPRRTVGPLPGRAPRPAADREPAPGLGLPLPLDLRAARPHLLRARRWPTSATNAARCSSRAPRASSATRPFTAATCASRPARRCATSRPW